MKLKKPIKGKKTDTPETPDDWMEYGAAEEENGDKFYGSDPAKALRFYQRAGDAYMQANLPAAHYNASRLLFHVHNRYSEETVSVQELSGVEEVFGARVPIVQDLAFIAEAHEQTIQMHRDMEFDADKSDLFYNAALVYSELLDAGEAPVVAAAERGMELLGHVMAYQASCLSAGEAFFDAMQTAVSALALVVAAMEAAEDGASLAAVAAASGSFVQDVLELAARAAAVGGGGADESEARAEYALARAAYTAAVGYSQDSPDAVIAVWADPSLPATPERYMQAADSLESFLFQRGIAPRAGAEVSAEMAAKADIYWRVLTEMTNSLKQADAALRQRLDAAKTGPQALGVGHITAQIARVHIARADIDLQRSRLPRELSEKDRGLLRRNCSAFLKNAMNLARASGGIRETFVERTQRNRRRVEAVYRLCLLEQKTSEAELDEILGVGRWQEEQRQLAQLWYWHDL